MPWPESDMLLPFTTHWPQLLMWVPPIQDSKGMGMCNPPLCLEGVLSIGMYYSMKSAKYPNLYLFLHIILFYIIYHYILLFIYLLHIIYFIYFIIFNIYVISI